MNEQVLGSQFVDNAEGLGVLGVRAGEAVENEDLLVLKIGHNLALDGVKFGLFDGTVHLAPGDLVMDGGGVHDELVVGAAASVLAGLDHQRAGVGELALTAAQGVLRQLGGGQIAVDSGGIDDAQGFQTISFHNKIPPFYRTGGRSEGWRCVRPELT